MQNITTNELRDSYQRFFESKGHVRIPSAPLVPENDPSVLFTTAGMHPLVPYLKGEPHPVGARLTNAQKCLRTTDIEEVGDTTHATVFEMLGNWSLGDYFKTEAITWSWEFLTDKAWLGLDPAYLAVSVFQGDDTAPRDEESSTIWQGIGVSKSRIAALGKDDNWWPAGGTSPGPQGPDTEMFYWTGQEPAPTNFDPTDKRWVEIWNDVFMQFNRDDSGTLTPLAQQNVDTGMGLERTVMVLGGHASIYEIDSFKALISLIRDNASEPTQEKAIRVVADHLKAIAFLLGDEQPVAPANTDQGYVLRRIIRRAMLHARSLGYAKPRELMQEGLKLVVHEYAAVYPTLQSSQESALGALAAEIEKFEDALPRGLKEFERVSFQTGQITGAQASTLFTTFGFPLEMTIEEAQARKIALAGDFRREFEQDQKKHQETSRTAAAGKFKGGLADHSEASVRYHTATHLLHQALRDVLGTHVLQKGSNITPERLRFDFSHPAKLTPEEISNVEAEVNRIIAANVSVSRQEMTIVEAKERGALGLFEEKYADRVSVYTIGDYSVEICGGPHVTATGALGTFKIVGEESIGSGRRRIKARLS